MTIAILMFAALLGCIPGAIAQSKGHSFVAWWFFGWMLFIVALPCSLMLKTRNEQPTATPHVLPPAGVSPAEEIERFATLKEKGLISEAEYEAKRKQLLGLPVPAELDVLVG